jgi:peptidoglycan/LPS O-acetylase OafA/YrhL
MGVDLFFVLSGYLIGLQLLRQVRDGRGVGLKEFYRRRAYRILPAYLVVLALYWVWAWRGAKGMSPLWEFLTFTENLFVDYDKNQAFSHVWSLCVEEHFYLLLPLVLMAMMRRARVWGVVSVMAGLVAFGMAVRWYELEHVLRPLAMAGEDFGVKYIERIYYPTYSRLDGLLAGVGLALMRVFRPGWWAALTRRANVWLGVGTVLVVVAAWMFWNRFDSVTGVAGASAVVGFPLLSVGLAMWVVGASDARCWLGRWRVPGARVVAMLAFSLYLTHKEVAHMVSDAWPSVMKMRDWRCVPVYAVSCLAVAAVLYVGVERPMLRLRDKRARRVDVEVLAEPAL